MKFVRIDNEEYRVPPIKIHIQPIHTGRTLCGYSIIDMKMIEVDAIEPTCDWCIESVNDLIRTINQMPARYSVD